MKNRDIARAIERYAAQLERSGVSPERARREAIGLVERDRERCAGQNAGVMAAVRVGESERRWREGLAGER